MYLINNVHTYLYLVSYSDNVADFKTFVSFDQDFEALGETTVLADVVLQASYTIITEDEPQFQGAETTAQRNTPVLLKV